MSVHNALRRPAFQHEAFSDFLTAYSATIPTALFYVTMMSSSIKIFPSLHPRPLRMYSAHVIREV